MALKIAVLLSGSGTTLQNLLDRSGAGELDLEFVCVISSRPDAYGLERARKHGIPAIPIVRKNYGSAAAFNTELWGTVRKHGAELVVLAGFMSLLEIPPDFENRVMNVHPALIPAFCGHGMYGHHVHEAVIGYGVKVSGATVHFANNEYDAGPIILQDTVPVLDDDTPESLAARVQAKERELYPKAIRLFAEGRLQVDGRRVRIREPR
ncbi:MAG TPA: phosphoribosylglycinamide formyltransferase [Candidatus Hydrogenedentes bacterium]|nr:phosphoribosylglycinamide formyltransferase [Candidatus Hydrogenedentota bacterium]HQM49535.1 phosphoribosylglycinamide formyltransferase [Candidatus Hydrogenedentota bacterium]